jgi:hypothetical protein
MNRLIIWILMKIIDVSNVLDDCNWILSETFNNFVYRSRSISELSSESLIR